MGRTIITEMHRLEADKTQLAADFPGYDFSLGQTWAGLSIVASRRGAGDGPLVLISSDPAEIRRHLGIRLTEGNPPC